jgi:5,10-methylenetetrahydromethanopterin reductase
LSVLSVSIDGRDAAGAFRDKVSAAESGGAERLWVASHLFQREPIAMGTLALATTTRLGVALMAISPHTVHPVHAAMAAATLDELFPGRVTMCFGVGAPADLGGAGIDGGRPLRLMRETIEVAGALLAGAPVRYEGQMFRVRDRALAHGRRPVPLLLAASGPQMLRLAGELADGVLISAGSSVEFVRWSLAQVDAGAKGRPLRRCGLVYAAADDDEAPAARRLRRVLAVTLRGRHHARNLELAGSALDQAALDRAVRAEAWDLAEQLVPDDIVRRHGACGTPPQMRERLEAYRQAGLDEIVLAGVRGAEQLRHVLDIAGSSRGGAP